jgi:hypothetical protein
MAIERVSVRVRDVNGPRGGVDHECRIKVVLSGLPSVMARAQDVALVGAIDQAIAAATGSVKRSVQRRRMRPLERARGGRRVMAP